MINEERLARPTWEMAHLQTQVRIRPYKASACEHRRLPEAQAPHFEVAWSFLLAVWYFQGAEGKFHSATVSLATHGGLP